MKNNKPTGLKRSSEFTSLKIEGRKFRVNPWILVSFKTTELQGLRYGMTVPKKVGSAVQRNRLKRWCREYFRTTFKNFSPSLDINVVFFPQSEDFYKNVSYQEFQREMDRTVRHLEKVCAKAFRKTAVTEKLTDKEVAISEK